MFDKKMIDDTINYAIDLGTSDSLIAYTKNSRTHIIKNHKTKEIYTPSVVAMNEEKIIVGQQAKNMLLLDPANAISEFKLNMGFPIKYTFKKTQKQMLPEQLSAEIIKDLRKSAYKENKEKVEHAVITVPASSNPIKTRATLKASQIAGLRTCHLLLEPIAAAIAYGLKTYTKTEKTWLIYDLGGGTFDASLVKPNGEEIEKLATIGTDNLGGKIFDWKIVELFRKKIIQETRIKNFTRNNPKHKKIYTKLKHEAEQAKILLNTQDTVKIEIKELLLGYDFEYTLTIDQLRKIMKPFIINTINLCQKLMEESDIERGDIEKIILVGGSTLSRVTREYLENEYEMPLEYSINPLTVVVQGASQYASTLTKAFTPPKPDKYTLILNYEKASTKSTFQLKGRIVTTDEKYSYYGYTLRINEKNEIPVDIDGTFKTQLKAQHKTNTYTIRVYDDENNEVTLDKNSPNTITYTKSIKAGKMQLPKTIKIGLNNGKTKTIAQKGVLLKYNHRTTVYTTKTLERALDDEIIIPVLSGENKNTKNNIQIGQIRITNQDITEQLPKNSRIDIHIHVENINDIKITIHIPHTRQTLTNTFEYVLKSQTIDETRKRYEKTKETINYYGTLEYPEIDEIISKIEEEKILDYIEILLNLAKDDSTIINTIQEYINHMNSYLEEIGEILEIETLKNNIEYKIIKLSEILDVDDKNLENIIKEYGITEKIEHLYKIHEKLIEIYVRQYTEETITAVLFNLRNEGIYSQNQQKAKVTMQEAQDNLSNHNLKGLYGNIRQLYELDERNDNESDSDVQEL